MNVSGRFNAQDYELRPDNSTLLLVDYQSLILMSVQSHDRAQLTRNISALARAARTFEVPTILTTMANGFGGSLLPELRDIFTDTRENVRTLINAWEDENVQNAVKQQRRKKVIIAGLWTELALALPVFSALEEGYTVYFVADASGCLSADIHQLTFQQLVQAGAKPRTWQQLMYSWQRDWSFLETFEAIEDIVRSHGSAFPPSAIYARPSANRGQDPKSLQAPRRGLRPAGLSKQS